MTNAKIKKVITAIEKVQEQIAECQSKLRHLEKQKTQLENEEIIAMFRREKLNEDEFAALLQAGRQKAEQGLLPEAPLTDALQTEAPQPRKEEFTDVNS